MDVAYSTLEYFPVWNGATTLQFFQVSHLCICYMTWIVVIIAAGQGL